MASIYNSTSNTLRLGTSNADFIENSSGKYVTILAQGGNDTIENHRRGSNSYIDGGESDDNIYNIGENVTIIGGVGNDKISLSSYAENVLIKYASGDGNDIIYGFKDNSTLSIGGSYSSQTSGDNIIVTVDDGKISLVGAAGLEAVSAVNIIGEKTSTPPKPSTEENSWKLSGTTATYGTSKKTLVTVKGVKSLGGISLSGKVVTVAASSLNKKKVSITGSGYTLKLADDVTKTKTKKAAWSLSNSTATYKSSYKTAGYKLSSDSKSISYTKATTAKALATIQGAKSTKGLSVSGKKITLKNSALNKKVSVSGGYDFNFASNYKKATISGSSNADTITTNGSKLLVNGGAGNDLIKIFGTGTTVTGGAGSDVFVQKSGNNVIADYAEEDLISLAGTAQVSTSGSDVIFAVESGKITVAGGADKTISYVDSEGKQTYSEIDLTSDVSISGKTIKLLEDYTEESFNVADYGKTLQNIDASEVLLDMEIIGNVLRNSILGGANNETLIGGKGNDILTGGEGSDVFVYSTGDGQDTITDYNADDIISIGSGTISDISVSGKDVIFKVGSGKITLKNAKNKIISYVEAKGNLITYPQTVIISGTTAKLTESYMSDNFNADDYNSSLRTIDATAVLHDLEIIGNKLMNTIIGGDGNDTIAGGKGNDCLKGGDGSDIFIYAKGDGNDIITDYAEEDKIQIASGTISTVKKSGSNVIFTVGSNKITVKGAASKTVTYVDKNGKTKYFPKPPESDIIMTDDNKTAILRETYSESTYTAGSSIIKIDASSVTRDLTVTGNGKANVILGGYEDDTIIGGKGNDTLQGGSGADVFVYANGDGNDRIVDYDEVDTIQITKGTIKNKTTNGSDVIFTIGSGKITVVGAASKNINVINSSGAVESWFVADDDNFAGNNLSSLVQNKAIDYFVAEVETVLTSAKALPILTSSSKK